MSSVGPINVADGGSEEFYTSEPFQLPEGVHVTDISWTGEIPPKTWVKAQFKSAENRDTLLASLWTGSNGNAEWIECSGSVPDLGEGRWIQYRLALGAVNGGRTPRVTRVDVGYAAKSR